MVVVTDPEFEYHDFDAGRAITYMQLAAWDAAVGSCGSTGVDELARHDLLGIPENLAVSAVVGFGVPHFAIETVEGQTDRRPLADVVFDGRYGTAIARVD